MSSELDLYGLSERHDMRDLRHGHGDCVIACTATILRQPYDRRFHLLHQMVDALLAYNATGHSRDDEAMDIFRAFLAGLGYALVVDTPKGRKKFGLCIACGESPRDTNGAGHGVVAYRTEEEPETARTIHDPHPSRYGLSGPVEEFYFFEPLTP